MGAMIMYRLQSMGAMIRYRLQSISASSSGVKKFLHDVYVQVVYV